MSWEDFRTTAPTYFFMGSPFPIELRVFGHSIHRFEWMKVITNLPHNGEFSEISLIFIDFSLISLIFHWFHWFPIGFQWITVNCRSGLATLGQCNRSIECPNTRNSIGNGLPTKKYVGAVVRKSSQLIIDAEIDHSENKMPVQKKGYHLGSQKKLYWFFAKNEYFLSQGR